LYYKETAKLTDYLNHIQYDNFNRLRTNHRELWAILPTLSPKNYSSLDLFDTEIGNIIKKYIGTYSDEAQNKTKLIYEI
jgi:hypothetical protein